MFNISWILNVSYALFKCIAYSMIVKVTLQIRGPNPHHADEETEGQGR